MYPSSKRNIRKEQAGELGLNPQKLLADWLENARGNYARNSRLSAETRAELVECLSLAEAAIRRADLELRLADRKS